jgi:hypothetical protein
MESNEEKQFMESLNPLKVSGMVIGYDKELHNDHAMKINITLPLGAIKRLMESYLEDLAWIREACVYNGMSGSTEIRLGPYCNFMLNQLIEAVTVNGQDGKAVCDEVFERKFKKRHDDMDSYKKAQENEPCDDPECGCRQIMGVEDIEKNTN